jgi:DNA-3-methyladenine glycosylase II
VEQNLLTSERQLSRSRQVNLSANKPISHLSLTSPNVWRLGARHFGRKDKVIAQLIHRVGPIKFEPDTDHYEALVGSIIYQQLAGSAARAILNRFKELYGGRIPVPKEFLATKILKLRKSGLSPQKISYLRDLCIRIENGSLDLPRLSGLPNEEVIEELDKVRGIGRWTAEMYLIFMLGRTDVLPVDDLGVQKAAQRLYRLRKLPTKEKFEQIAKNWGSYSSIATLYLWKSVEKPETPAKW